MASSHVCTPTSRTQSPLKCKRRAARAHVLDKVPYTGIPRPQSDKGRYVMVPPIFGAMLTNEPFDVIKVFYEVLAQTIGYIGDNQYGRREWASLSYRHFERKGLMSRNAAQRALARAVKAGYIAQRPGKRRSHQYAICWDDLEFDTP